MYTYTCVTKIRPLTKLQSAPQRAEKKTRQILVEVILPLIERKDEMMAELQKTYKCKRTLSNSVDIKNASLVINISYKDEKLLWSFYKYY